MRSVDDRVLPERIYVASSEDGGSRCLVGGAFARCQDTLSAEDAEHDNELFCLRSAKTCTHHLPRDLHWLMMAKRMQEVVREGWREQRATMGVGQGGWWRE